MARRLFSIRPAITLRGRTFKGVRGWAGKPLHPPLTDLPVAGYVLAATFDVISLVAGEGGIGRDAYVAGTWAMVAGLVVSVPTAVTGLWDWWRSTPRYTQAWRTANWHLAVMASVTVLAVIAVVLRLQAYGAEVAPTGTAILTVVVGLLVSYGATYGGTLIFDYGFNVENATSSAEWQESEQDVYPTDK